MNVAHAYEAVLRFLSRYERPIASALFVFGFATDVLTFSLLNLSSVMMLFTAYLVIAVISSLISHYTYDKREKGITRALAAFMPLAVQFTFGSLLSGFLIFYTKSAVLSISWPFIFLLLLIFFGNEVLRNYRSHLIFQTVLMYFCFYAFSVFAVPLYVGRISSTLFYISTLIALAAYGLYILLLKWLSWDRLRTVLVPSLISVSAITLLIMGSYISGYLPPIPLTLKSGGIYQSIERVSGGYSVQGEQIRPWYDPRPQTVHHQPGTPLYAYSAIFAPGSFSTSVVHVWQRYNTTSKKWVTQSMVTFPLSGGREGGYRGYSLKYDPEPGSWRVLVQTLNGQTIGDIPFTVVNTTEEPSVTTRSL